MKKTQLLNLLIAFLFTGAILSSCQQDNVKPQANNNTPDLAAADNDPHPLPDPVCSDFDTLRLMSENGSFKVNYCGSFGTTMLPCPPTMPEWGFVEILNGEDLMICNFTMAPGWFIDFSRSRFGTSTDFQFNQNGIPIIATDWLPTNIDPVVNRWQLALNLADLPGPCFDMGLQLTVVKLDFFAGVDQNSATSLWGYNAGWNNPNSSWASPSPFVCHWCPSSCGPTFTTVTGGDCSGCNSENTVNFIDCDTAQVSSCKDLSNVVLVFTDNTWQKFDGLSGLSGTYTGTGANTGKEIARVYVKSGCFQSGDGPGWGRRFDSPCNDDTVISTPGSGGGNGGGGNNGGNGNGNGGGNGGGNGNGNGNGKNK